MKIIITLSVVVFLYLACLSCKSTCTPPPVNNLLITNFDSSIDTSVTIYKYETGTNFSQFVDSTVLSSKYTPGEYGYYFASNGNTQYDYMITVNPGGATHTVKNFSYGHEKKQVSGDDECMTSVHFYIDGVLYTREVATDDIMDAVAVRISN